LLVVDGVTFCNPVYARMELITAAKSGNIDELRLALRLALDNGADVNATDEVWLIAMESSCCQ
jgi:hypothetical protein